MTKHKVLLSPNVVFSPKGRLSRLPYAIYFWTCMILLFLLGWGADILSDLVSDGSGNLLNWLANVLTVLILYASVCVVSQRLHDVGLTGWLAMIMFAGVGLDLLTAFAGTVGLKGTGLNIMAIATFAGYLMAMFLGVWLTVWRGQDHAARQTTAPPDTAPPTT